ncbi:MAG: hypothetical protein ABI663_11155 [Chryseolinea sp.]
MSKRISIYLSVVLSTCLAIDLQAQNQYTDSLKRIVEKNQVDSKVKINTLLLLAKYYQHTVSRYDSAKTTLDEAIQMAARLRATELLIDATFNKGVLLYYSYGNREEGLSLFQKSYELALLHNHPNKLSRIYYGLGIANDHIKNYRATEEYFLKAYNYSIQFKNDVDRSKVIMGINSFYIDRNQPEKAEPYTAEIFTLVEQSDNPVVLTNGWSFIATMYEREGKLKEACEAKEKALTNQRKTNITIDITLNIIELAELYWSIGETQRIKELGCELFEYENIPNYTIQASVSSMFVLFAKVYEKEGNYEQAYEYQKKASELNSKIADSKLNDKLAEAQVRFDWKQQQEEIKFQANKLRYRSGIILLLTIFSLLTLLALFIFVRNSKRRHTLSKVLLEKNELLEIQKMEIEMKQEELTTLNNELAYVNKNLDNLVKEKTYELVIKNKKLIDYSFLNAHSLRGPLARIMGLVNLIRLQETPPESVKLINMLDASSKELDEVVHKISKIVESDELLNQ